MTRAKVKDKSLLFIVDGVDKAIGMPKDSQFFLHSFLSDLCERTQKLTVGLNAFVLDF
jgi:hypothetical protein